MKLYHFLSQLLLNRRWPWVGAVVVHFLLGFMLFDRFPVGAYQDDAWYVAGAMGLAKGLGYTQPWTPNLLPETYLPVGYSLFLVPWVWLFPMSFKPLVMWSLLASAATVAGSYWYYRQVNDSVLWAWLGMLLFAVNTMLVEFSTLVMSEASYLLVTMMVILVVYRWSDKAEVPIIIYWLIGFGATVGYFVRIWGLALVVAVIVYYMMRRRWGGVIGACVPFLLMYTVWLRRNMSLGGRGGSYGINNDVISKVPDVLETTLVSESLVVLFTQDLPNLLVPIFSQRIEDLLAVFYLGPLLGFLALGLIGLILLGGVKQMATEITVAELYVGAYVGIILLVPFSGRYWLPLLPFLIHYMLLGLQTVIDGCSRFVKQRKVLEGVVLVSLLLVAGLHIFRVVQKELDPIQNELPNVSIGAEWIGAQVVEEGGEQVTIMAAKPQMTYIYSEQTVVPYPEKSGGEYAVLEGREEHLWGYFKAKVEAEDVDYILIEPILRLGPLMRSAYAEEILIPNMMVDERFSLVFSDEPSLVLVFRVGE
ncbi:MAG TPA: hypothetical protein VLL52_20545 [Anaerolineae bacterium]|nr:hypothetical protein [Anaerolineae bacterium]